MSSSIRLSSIFGHNKNNDITTNKRSSSTNTTFSKRMSKRLSSTMSLLKSSNKSNSHQRAKVDTIFPSAIDTNSTNSLLSFGYESDDDDHSSTLFTPTTLSSTTISQSMMSEKMILDETTLSLLLAPVEPIQTKLEVNLEHQPYDSVKVEVNSITTSPSSLIIGRVREELQRMFEDTDREIEQELAQSRCRMIQSIYEKPRFKYY